MNWMWNTLFIGGIITTLFHTTVSGVYVVDRTVDVSLKNSSLLHTCAYTKQLILLSNETLRLSVKDIPENVNFAVVQAHSHAYNITLSYSENLTRSRYVTGTNIGLNIQNNSYLYLINSGPHVNISVMIAVTIYSKTAPIPGGCNMELETHEAPYMKLTDKVSMVQVLASPALISNTTCGVSKIQYDVYHFFLPSQDFTESIYFQGIKNMLTPKRIQEYGIKSAHRAGPPLRRLYNSFVGNGVVYVAIATIENTTYSAAYVPAITYSCSIVHSDNSCEVLQSGLSKLMCALIFFLGVLLCTIGHRCFRLQMFLTGAVLGGLLAYIAGSAMKLSYNGVMWSSVLGCFLGGIIWWKAWNILGRPVVAVLASGLMLGYLSAGVITTYLPDDMTYLQSDSAFWMMFVCIMLTAALVLALMLCWGSVISCALLGSYAITLPLDYYLGGHLKYIVIDSIRRATVPDFKYAVTQPPFQLVDVGLLTLWCVVAGGSAYFQWWRSRGRAPFPPRAATTRRRGGSFRPRRYWTEDVQPLLRDVRELSYGSVDDDVFEPPEPAQNRRV